MSQDTTTWLITGASRGLGLEMTKQLLQSPTNVVFATCRDPQNSSPLKELRTNAQGELHIVQLDVVDITSIETSVRAVEKVLGGRGLDYLINNAGICDHDDTARRFDTETFLKTFRTNVLGPALISGAYYPLLDKSKRKVIVNVSSQLGSMAWKHGPDHATYSSCKAALNMFTTKQAFDRPEFIIFVMCPGWAKTDMGGADAPLDPQDTIRGLLQFTSSATLEHSGRFWRFSGEELGW